MIGKKYIRNRILYEINKSSNIDSRLDYKEIIERNRKKFQIMNENPEVLLGYGSNFIYKKIINFLFSKKEVIKKLPLIGSYIVSRKNKLLKTHDGDIYIDDIVALPFFEFIDKIYKVLLEREIDIDGFTGAINANRVGLSNEVIAYMVMTSKEFLKRNKVVCNTLMYRKKYRRYILKKKIFNIPILGIILKLLFIPNEYLRYKKTLIEYEQYIISKMGSVK